MTTRIRVFRDVRVILLLLVVGLGQLSASIAQDRDASPTISPNLTVSDMFPSNLYCSEIENTSQGPEWNTITVGKSTPDELLSVLEKIGNYQTINTTQDLESRTFLHQPVDFTISNWIDVCVRENKVTALSFEVVLPYDISTLLVLYGEPDAIVDTPEYFTKLFFWFEQGIIAGVFSIEGDSLGMVSNIILMPYQTAGNYKKRWPFTVIPDYLKEDVINPFVFEDILATGTFQPSATPTSTLVRSSIKTNITPTSTLTHR